MFTQHHSSPPYLKHCYSLWVLSQSSILREGPLLCWFWCILCLDTGRTIIFTTHHLDEAEMLSDHVAVLQQGKLKCYAPPAGLKETYGQGLTLTLTKQVRSDALLFHWGSLVPHMSPETKQDACTTVMSNWKPFVQDVSGVQRAPFRPEQWWLASVNPRVDLI